MITSVQQLTRIMLNPNSNFYIDKLNKITLNILFKIFNSKQFTSNFWTAFGIAQARRLKIKKYVAMRLIRKGEKIWLVKRLLNLLRL